MLKDKKAAKHPGSKIPIMLRDLGRYFAKTSCKSLQKNYKIASKTAYKISCQDILKRCPLAKILTKILPRSYKINQLFRGVQGEQ